MRKRAVPSRPTPGDGACLFRSLAPSLTSTLRCRWSGGWLAKGRVAKLERGDALPHAAGTQGRHARGRQDGRAQVARSLPLSAPNVHPAHPTPARAATLSDDHSDHDRQRPGPARVPSPAGRRSLDQQCVVRGKLRCVPLPTSPSFGNLGAETGTRGLYGRLRSATRSPTAPSINQARLTLKCISCR